MPEEEKYDVLEKIGAQTLPFIPSRPYANYTTTGHGSFGIIRKVKRKSDGYVRHYPPDLPPRNC
jgi:hypothetical protein